MGSDGHQSAKTKAVLRTTKAEKGKHELLRQSFQQFIYFAFTAVLLRWHLFLPVQNFSFHKCATLPKPMP